MDSWSSNENKNASRTWLQADLFLDFSENFPEFIQKNPAFFQNKSKQNPTSFQILSKFFPQTNDKSGNIYSLSLKLKV